MRKAPWATRFGIRSTCRHEEGTMRRWTALWMIACLAVSTPIHAQVAPADQRNTRCIEHDGAAHPGRIVAGALGLRHASNRCFARIPVLSVSGGAGAHPRLGRQKEVDAPEDPKVSGERGQASRGVRGVIAGACSGWKPAEPESVLRGDARGRRLSRGQCAARGQRTRRNPRTHRYPQLEEREPPDGQQRRPNMATGELPKSPLEQNNLENCADRRAGRPWS